MLGLSRSASLMAVVLALAGCISDSQYNKAITVVDAHWKEANDRIVAEIGSRTYDTTRFHAFVATQKAAQRLQMVVEEQDLETGFLFVSSPAPAPLTAAEWAEVEKAHTKELRKLILPTVGPAAWFKTLDPSGKDVLANVFVTEATDGVEVSVTLRLRPHSLKSGRVRRLQPPPTAMRLGLNKFWSIFEEELGVAGKQNLAIPEKVIPKAPAAKPPPATGEPTQVAGIDLSPPRRVLNPDAVAVIIGNKTYRGRVPDVDFAHNDAEAMKRFVIGSLGYRDGNVIDLRDATRAEMDGVLGNARTHKGKLWRWARPEESDVVVYYSGHGVPGLRDGRSYLLPVDADPNAPEINGYALDLLYQNLARLEARSVTVYLDACFSGDSEAGPLINPKSGLRVTPKVPAEVGITVVTAAQGDQVASWDETAKQGLFTKYLLAALGGKADAGRYGDGDGKIKLKEVHSYLDREMTYAARRYYGRDQKAMVKGDPDRVLAPNLNAKLVGN